MRSTTISGGGDALPGDPYTDAYETKRSGNVGCTVGVNVELMICTAR
jgi:hypothetical protein